MDLISVIVPVYKVEPYLDQCVQSIVDQTYKNLEIILVDDGSPDNCGAMCDAWAERDSRIKVIHKANEGSAQTRNVGIHAATGDYIGFVDSDDWISPHMYERLHTRLTQTGSDIVACGVLRVWPEPKHSEPIMRHMQACVLDRTSAMKAMIESSHLIMTVWDKLYRSSTVKNILFPIGRTIDDEFWTWKAIANANIISTITEPLYFYRQRPDSIMTSKAKYHLLDVVDAKCERHQYILEYLPNLANESCWNLLGTCLYQGQVMMATFPYRQIKAQVRTLVHVVRSYSVDSQFFSNLSCKRKIRYLMIKHSFIFFCKLRNLLHIGL